MNRDVLINGLPAKLELEDGHFTYEREDGASCSAAFSVQALEPGHYSVLIGDSSYHVTLGSKNEFLVNGFSLTVEAFDARDVRLRGSGAGAHASAQILSPMPGKIVRVLVSVDDQVTEGQGLVVVEAMKMQNEMKAPKAGRVVEVRAQAGATVTAGEILVVVV